MGKADALSCRADFAIDTAEENKNEIVVKPMFVCTVNCNHMNTVERQDLVSDFHDTPVAGHRGWKAMYNQLWKHY